MNYIIDTNDRNNGLSLLLKHWLAFWAVPLALGFGMQIHATKMEPLNGTVLVVTPNHFTVRHLLAEAIGWLIRIHGHVEHFLRNW